MEKYQDLIVWQKAMEAVKQIYHLTKILLDNGNNYALIDQMRRAAISIPSNIAEGYERNSTKEYIRFLSIANGSKAELLTQVEICKMLELVPYADRDYLDEVIDLLNEIGKMLNVMIKRLNSKPPNP